MRQKFLTQTAMVACAAVITACATAPSPQTREATNEDILSAVQTPRQEALWSDRVANDDLPPVDAIEVPDDPVTARRAPRPRTQDSEIRAKRATLAVDGAAAIMPIDDNGALTRAYFGDATIEAVEADRIVLRTGQDETLEILYRAPSQRSFSRGALGETMKLEIAPQERRREMRSYNITLSDARRRPALVAILENSDAPISHQAEFSDIRIRQIDDARSIQKSDPNFKQALRGRNIPVEVTSGGETIRLIPGDIAAGGEDWGQPLDIVVYTSAANPPEEAWSDTPPYALKIEIFATDMN
ncbi:MAG: hypothetical protein AAGJ73_08020 [Pseudomonadota bacterium]